MMKLNKEALEEQLDYMCQYFWNAEKYNDKENKRCFEDSKAVILQAFEELAKDES